VDGSKLGPGGSLIAGDENLQEGGYFEPTCHSEEGQVRKNSDPNLMSRILVQGTTEKLYFLEKQPTLQPPKEGRWPGLQYARNQKDRTRWKKGRNRHL